VATIGELFLNLGIRGGQATLSTLNAVKQGVGDLTHLSFTAKAGILGIFYALQQFTSSSTQTGTNLKNFNALLGVSNQTLQQYQYVAAQAGITNEEMASSFKSVQNVMTMMRFGKGAPEGMSMLMGKLGGQFDPNRAKTDTEYVMRKLQEYATLEKDVSKRNLVMKSFGLGEGVIAGMGRNIFTQSNISRSPFFNDQQVAQLDKINSSWIRLGIQIKMAVGQFNSKYGLELTNSISNIIKKIEKLIESLAHIAEKFHLFEIFGKYIDDWAKAFEIVAQSTDKLDKSKFINTSSKQFSNVLTQKGPQGDISRNALFAGLYSGMTGGSFIGGALKGALSQFFIDMTPDLLGTVKEKTESLKTKFLKPFQKDVWKDFPSFSDFMLHPEEAKAKAEKLNAEALLANINPKVGNPAVPSLSPLTTNNQKTSTQHNNVNQTFNFQSDGSDHKQVGDVTQKAITKAFYQIPQGGF
jgi:hypothetical protein